jgi:DNA adenine methylase
MRVRAMVLLKKRIYFVYRCIQRRNGAAAANQTRYARKAVRMNGKTPHIVQYQGSKRILAPQILSFMPRKFARLVEPFSGMAAVSIAVAAEGRTGKYVLNDLNAPLAELLRTAVETPDALIKKYGDLWKQQFDCTEGHVAHFYRVRDQFNSGEQTAENMLYLLARCVKGSVRYGQDGNFNQSPDKRRHGTNPKNIAANVYAVSALLKGRATFCAADYREVLKTVRYDDLVYLDPPYQGVTDARDRRYFAGVAFDEFAEAVETLNRKGADYLISYDGECGGKAYGEDLPKELGCTKILLNAGLSTQATLLGKRSTTYEALYVSRNLYSYIYSQPRPVTLWEEVAL